MKPLLNALQPKRATSTSASGDDSLGGGMDMALTIALFVIVGALTDEWTGLFPVCTIAMIVVAAVGSFLRMKFGYDAAMDRLEAERLGVRRTQVEEAS